MNIYLAARWERRDDIAEIAQLIEEMTGHEVVSRWLTEPDNTNLALQAQHDLDDIDKCSVFVLFSEDPQKGFPRGGRHFEAGYAFAQLKTIIVVGPKENIFHHLPDVTCVKSVPALLNLLR